MRATAVSVVVPTYKRPEFLERCLAALLAQELDPATYEVIVADDAASEETCHQVARWAERALPAGPAVRYVPVHGTRGPAGARNAGWRLAKGDVIAFTDDDCQPQPDWLTAGLDALAGGAAAAAGRIVVPLPERPTDYEADAAKLEIAEFVTANCFVRRDALAAIGGFDQRFQAAWREDSDLHFALLERGELVVSAPEAVVLHPVRPAKWGICLSQQRKSFYNALLYKKHPRLYRERIQSRPPLRYYAAVGAIGATAGAAVLRKPHGVALGALAWTAVTAGITVYRLGDTAPSARNLAELAVTSAAIPPLAVGWRLRGAWHFRVLFA